MKEYELISIFFSTQLPKPSAKAALPQDPVEVLRRQYWFEGLRLETGLKTAYALEKHFEPNSFKEKAGVSFYRNKWRNYERGLNTPNSRLVDLVEVRQPGSAGELRHVLWELLREDCRVAHRGDALLRQLRPEVQAIMFRRRVTQGGMSQYEREPCSQRLCQQLERRADLDVLACLVILIREAVETFQIQQMEMLHRSLFNVLLMLGASLQARKIATRLFALFRDRIFALAATPYRRFSMSIDEYLHATFTLNLVVYRLKHVSKPDMHWPERVRLMRKVLAGGYGFDLKFALCPSYVLDASSGPVPSAVLDKLESDAILRRWGWSSVTSDQPEPMPPPRIWEALKLTPASGRGGRGS